MNQVFLSDFLKLVISQPFDLDYFQVLTTTCELLIETYTKIYSYLGSSSSLSNPSLSSSSTSFFPPSSSESLKSTSSNSNSGGLSQNLAEIVVKIDSRLKVRFLPSSSLSGESSETINELMLYWDEIACVLEIDCGIE